MRFRFTIGRFVSVQVSVEFYGIPRQRAGVPRTTASGARLGDVLADLAGRFPELARDCLDGGRLRPGFVASISGERFVNDPDTKLPPEAEILILSADAGG